MSLGLALCLIVCFPQVALDINHHRTLYDLHHKVNPKEQVVGWYGLDSLYVLFNPEAVRPEAFQARVKMSTPKFNQAVYEKALMTGSFCHHSLGFIISLVRVHVCALCGNI